MGAVYLAEQLAVGNRSVALKVHWLGAYRGFHQTGERRRDGAANSRGVLPARK